MSNEHTSIHEFDFNLICEYFAGLERQGPGSEQITLKALGFTEMLDSDAHIADIGCGTGGQTLTLAANSPARITGIDLSADFIEKFNKNAANNHLQHRMKGLVASMEMLPFQENELDMIWCEGAIYNIGFEKGLNDWHRFLKPGGYIAITEASWFTTHRPTEISDFWNEAYPGINTIPAKINQLQQAGYIPVASFILPENCWTDHFYTPQKKLQDTFLQKYRGNATAEALVANEKREAELYYTYKAYYGYVFYIGKKL
jgi:ubiquinone/menaquinone biosynthesis C-methylase UbiE